MNKKVNFFTVELFESVTSQETDYKKLKEIFVEIINDKATKHDDFYVLDLTRDKDLHYVADIFAYEDQHLMIRISCQKPSGAYLHRDYSTNIPEAILHGISEQEEGIELYTYAYLNYDTGILALVNQKGAPSHRVLNHVLSLYNVNYYMNFVPIPNANGIDRIYNSNNSQITQVEIEVPVPSAEVLQNMFGWGDNDILDVQGRGMKATMKLSCVERKPLTDDETSSKGLIDCIKSKITEYNKAKIRAKADGKKTQDYNFFDENFTYPVEIPSYHIVSGEKRYYTADELISIYSDNLIMAFNENYQVLKAISDR